MSFFPKVSIESLLDLSSCPSKVSIENQVASNCPCSSDTELEEIKRKSKRQSESQERRYTCLSICSDVQVGEVQESTSTDDINRNNYGQTKSADVAKLVVEEDEEEDNDFDDLEPVTVSEKTTSHNNKRILRQVSRSMTFDATPPKLEEILRRRATVCLSEGEIDDLSKSLDEKAENLIVELKKLNGTPKISRFESVDDLLMGRAPIPANAIEPNGRLSNVFNKPMRQNRRAVSFDPASLAPVMEKPLRMNRRAVSFDPAGIDKTHLKNSVQSSQKTFTKNLTLQDLLGDNFRSANTSIKRDDSLRYSCLSRMSRHTIKEEETVYQ